ncbi:DUF4328 domain-containing protein [Myroides sp. 1354]|uniref:DUF4328 domain-containing protein n=1 Tax=unclassified Myroides TaxID=2642485 RepID=UPI002576B3CD|nr:MULTISPECIES: DUF4328 domain-containing protein [unclassified Myroides]MDM1046261.1 DUF4328 domain-containing protein [Myroides sp. R163-1]MDM1057197.1 DUF4328 domain-containing protein [Myroides sp. 1354]MDM1070392.1 DUF4328 domain-containing protein [Myroides sp. 1372]
MTKLKPNGQRAKNAILLLWIMLALDIISFISSYFQYDLLQNLVIGREITVEEISANDTREQIIGLLYIFAYIVSIITFIQWFRRAYYNLHQKVSNLSHAEGWAAGSWFVPILCLFRPYLIMKELYEETKVVLTKKGIPSIQNLNTNLLGLWWAFWLLNNAFGQFVLRYAQRAEAIDELTTTTVASMANNSIGILLALLTIKVITNYAAVEPLLVKNEEEPIND